MKYESFVLIVTNRLYPVFDIEVYFNPMTSSLHESKSFVEWPSPHKRPEVLTVDINLAHDNILRLLEALMKPRPQLLARQLGKPDVSILTLLNNVTLLAEFPYPFRAARVNHFWESLLSCRTLRPSLYISPK